jgi:hypothetical protein
MEPTMTTNGSATFEVRVTSADDKGIKLDGSEQWLNYSRSADVPHPPARPAGRVVVGTDYFIRQLEVVDSTEAAAPMSNVARVGRPLAPDRTAMRLAVLLAAAAFSAGGSRAGGRQERARTHPSPSGGCAGSSRATRTADLAATSLPWL